MVCNMQLNVYIDDLEEYKSTIHAPPCENINLEVFIFIHIHYMYIYIYLPNLYSSICMYNNYIMKGHCFAFAVDKSISWLLNSLCHVTIPQHSFVVPYEILSKLSML